MPDYYSMDEAAQKLGKSEEEVRELVTQGKLRAFRDAGTFKFRRADIDAIAPESAEPAKGPEGKSGDSDKDELLFLIDEEGTPGESDDLTLIGEGDVKAAAEEEKKGLLPEDQETGGGEGTGEEALTAVMESPEESGGAKGASNVDLFAEAPAAEAEAEPTTPVVSARADRLRAAQQAAQAKSPAMTALLFISILALIVTGIFVFNSFVETKPAFINSLVKSVAVK